MVGGEGIARTGAADRSHPADPFDPPSRGAV
jgi:hypothetical protein